MIKKTAKVGGQITSYEYDAENKLVRAVINGRTVNYKYDGLGRRVEKEVVDVTTTITRFIYDNEDILLELDGSNNITARYTHGPGIDEPLIMEKGGASFFYHADGLGSIAEITNQSGTVAQSYTYSSFGKIESQLDPNFIQPYTFTAREFDPETDLYFNRGRTYDWRTGRFVQRDLFLDLVMRSMPSPAQAISLNTQVLNGYSYVEGRPVTHLDPLGLWGFGIQAGAQAEAGAGIIGAGGQGGIGGGFFASGFFNRPSLGAFLQGGAFAGTPFGGFGWPGEKGGALGASVGGGVSAFLTNAVCVEQLAGPFTTTSVNVGLGPFKFSAQYATDGKTWVFSFGPPFAGATYGISASIYQTSTTILGSTRR